MHTSRLHNLHRQFYVNQVPSIACSASRRSKVVMMSAPTFIPRRGHLCGPDFGSSEPRRQHSAGHLVMLWASVPRYVSHYSSNLTTPRLKLQPGIFQLSVLGFGDKNIVPYAVRRYHLIFRPLPLSRLPSEDQRRKG